MSNIDNPAQERLSEASSTFAYLCLNFQEHEPPQIWRANSEAVIPKESISRRTAMTLAGAAALYAPSFWGKHVCTDAAGSLSI